MIRVVLGLGSNAPYGGLEPVELLSGACRELKKILAAPVFSSLYDEGYVLRKSAEFL